MELLHVMPSKPLSAVLPMLLSIWLHIVFFIFIIHLFIFTSRRLRYQAPTYVFYSLFIVNCIPCYSTGIYLAIGTIQSITRFSNLSGWLPTVKDCRSILAASVLKERLLI